MPRRLGPSRATLRSMLFLFLLALPGLPLIGATGFFIGHNVVAAHRVLSGARSRATTPTLPAPPNNRRAVTPSPPTRRSLLAARYVRQVKIWRVPSTPHDTTRARGATTIAARVAIAAPARAHRPLALWSIPVTTPKPMTTPRPMTTPKHRSNARSVVVAAPSGVETPHAAAHEAVGHGIVSAARRPLTSNVATSRVRRRAGIAPPPPAPDALPVPPVLARAAYLYDVTDGRALYAKDAEDGLPMASTTKIMTALLAVKYGHLDDMVTASYAAATIGESSMYLQQGEQLTLRDLLYGLILPSGNDAAIAIAEHVGGSVPAFVAMMNREAALLGMTHTHFVTPHGLDAVGHYASAHDMARLAIAAMRYPAFRQIVSTRSYVIPATAHNDAHYLYNINQPLWWYPGVIGVKPGSTGAAGRCAVEWVVRGNHTLLLVLLGGANLVTDVRDLLNWGFGDFSHWYSPLQVPVFYAPEYLGWDGPALWLPTASGGRYYALTGHTVREPLLDRYLNTGGFARYGAPTSEGSLDAHGAWSQRFAGAWLFYNPRTGRVAQTEQAVQ